jgi:serine protease Do
LTIAVVVAATAGGDLAAAQAIPRTTIPVIAGQLTGGDRGYPSYRTLTDEYEAIKLRVPAVWKDVETGRWSYEGRDVGAFIAASRDLDALYGGRAEAGVFVGASRVLAQQYKPEDVLARELTSYAGKCRHGGRYTYVDPFYTGAYDSYSACSGGLNMLVVAVVPAQQQYLILLRIAVVSRADVEAMARILDSFQVVDQLDSDHHHDH